MPEETDISQSTADAEIDRVPPADKFSRGSRTIPIKVLSRMNREEPVALVMDVYRPQTRADCQYGPRPCPFVSCKYNLYLDIATSGSLTLNFPEKEVSDLVHSCVLDIADKGGVTLEEVGATMNLTRERVRQLETRGLAKLKAKLSEDEP